MPRPCSSICARPDKADIIAARYSEGLSFNAIGARYSLPPTSVKRCFAGHIAKPAPALMVDSGGDLAVIDPAPMPTSGTPCRICPSPLRRVVEEQLAANASLRSIETLTNHSLKAIERHRDRCVASALERTRALQTAQTTSSRLKQLLDEAEEYLFTAKQKLDLKAWGTAVGRLEGAVRLQAQLSGELGGDPDAAILASAKWREIKTIISEALRPFPDAMQAVAEAFAVLGARRG